MNNSSNASSNAKHFLFIYYSHNYTNIRWLSRGTAITQSSKLNSLHFVSVLKHILRYFSCSFGPEMDDATLTARKGVPGGPHAWEGVPGGPYACIPQFAFRPLLHFCSIHFGKFRKLSKFT